MAQGLCNIEGLSVKLLLAAQNTSAGCLDSARRHDRLIHRNRIRSSGYYIDLPCAEGRGGKCRDCRMERIRAGACRNLRQTLQAQRWGSRGKWMFSSYSGGAHGFRTWAGESIKSFVFRVTTTRLWTRAVAKIRESRKGCGRRACSSAHFSAISGVMVSVREENAARTLE